VTALAVCDLRAGYDGAAVVRDVSLTVDRGEVVALLGPNGAGKSTTLMTVAGLLPALGGTVEVFGAPVRHKRAHRIARRGLAFVPEDRSLFGTLTVRENLRLGSRSRRGTNVDRVLDYFPALAPLLDRRAGVLSGGEQQMLAIGRAIVSNPKLLMVDELSLGLAPIIVEQLLPVLRRIAVEHECGLLIVEQHVDLALEHADRAYVLAHGELVLEGRVSELARDRDLLESSYLGGAVLA
jgi:branched-chain amino acid transport system ATP-binding protein